MTEPGAAQDQSAQRKWIEHFRRQHRLERFSPPRAACSCGVWSRSAPGEMGIYRQRDWLLDEFLEHLAAMKAEQRRRRAERRAAKKAAQAQP